MVASRMRTSRCSSAWADARLLPWLYPYREDTQSTRPGSVGFLDRWTVTASRFAQAVAIEERDAFDKRFGTVLST